MRRGEALQSSVHDKSESMFSQTLSSANASRVEEDPPHLTPAAGRMMMPPPPPSSVRSQVRDLEPGQRLGGNRPGER